MNLIRQNPIQKNEGFTCENCHQQNQKATKTCRNHCTGCLYSKHVDDQTPGDRLSSCQGLMEAVFIEYDGKKGHQILHQCLRCKKEILNKTAEDDNIDTITSIMKRQNLHPPHAND